MVEAKRKAGRLKGSKRPHEIPLRHRHDAFVREYLKDYRARNAAIRAGISPRSAHTLATRLLRDPYVREQIEIHEAQVRERYDLDHDKIIRDMIETGYQAVLAGQYAAAVSAKKLVGMHAGISAWVTGRVELSGPNGGPIPVTAATVVLRPEDLTAAQRAQLKTIALQALALEQQASRAGQEPEEEEE